MALNSVQEQGRRGWHDVITRRTHPERDRPITGRGLWKKPNMAAAQREARPGSRGSPLPIRHMRAAMTFERHQSDCEEKRDPDE